MTIHDIKSKGLLLFEVVSGSKSFGLDTSTSDTDLKGVFYLPKEHFYGLDYIPQISNETNDEVYYELGRFVELLLKNNPNILEILATPEDCIVYKHPIMNHLTIEDFLSKRCKDSFAGYAMTQIKKARGLKKKIVNPMSKERKNLLDFCYVLKGNETLTLPDWLNLNKLKQEDCGLIKLPNAKGGFALFYDTNVSLGYKGVIKSDWSDEVSLSSVPKSEKVKAYLFCNIEGYSKYCKKYTEYWEWIDKRNEERYNTNKKHGKNYDSKNMMHTIRLLETAERIFIKKELTIRVTNRVELLQIKSGEMEYEALLNKADDLLASINAYYQKSDLPDTPDKKKILQLLVLMRNELYH